METSSSQVAKSLSRPDHLTSNWEQNEYRTGGGGVERLSPAPTERWSARAGQQKKAELKLGCLEKRYVEHRVDGQ